MDIQKFVSRLLCLLLCAAMVVSYLPGISMIAKAEEIEVGEAVTEDSVVVEPVPEASAGDAVVEPVPSEEPELIASGTSADGIDWVLDANGHLEITGSGAMTDAPWLDYVDNIYTVTIGEGITSIAENGFHSCGYMTAIEIPNSVTAIGQFAFGYCYALTTVDIPDGVTEIAPYTFYECESLGKIVIPEGVTTIGNSAFLECESLSEVIIPDSVITIGKFAFAHCSNLAVLVVGSSVESIGQEAFYSCGLKLIRFKGDAPTFGTDAFTGAFCPGYYPADNSTWTADAKIYPVNWLPLGELIGMSLLTDELIPIAVGTVLDENYIQAELIYEDDIRFAASFADLTISDYDTSEVGRQEITISCGDQFVTAVLAIHEGAANQLIDPALYPESEHDYSSNMNEYKTFEVPGATSITLTFAPESYLETNYDKLYIYDGQGVLIATLTGNGFGGTSVKVPGSKVVLRLYTDGSMEYYGYAFSEIRANTVNHTGEAVEAVDPTCEEDGHTAGTYCTICEALVGSTVLPALGHCYDAEVTPPTQDTQGYTTYTCPVCGDSYVDDYTTYDNVANGQCGENVTWVLNYEGTLTISGTGPMYEEYGYGTMDWKDAGYEIRNVIIEDGVTSISDYAFADCPNLTSVWMADTVETIGCDAFYYCYNLTDLTIGNGVITIESYAFNNCYNLKSVIIPDSVQTIHSGAFQYCTALESLTIGSGVTYIGENAFRSAQKVTTLVLPESLDTIEVNAFTDCDALISVSIPAATSYIAVGAFDDCDAMLSFEVHPDNAYYSSDSCGVLFDKNQNVLMKYPLALGGEYSVPGTVNTIGYRAFNNAHGLTAVTIPGSVKTIDYEAFYNCDALTSVTLGEGIETIEDYAFGDCDQLQAVVIPDSLTTLGARAFQHCGDLRAVTLGSGLTNMGGYVFESCTALETVEFTGDGLYISYGVFNNVTATAYYPMNNETWTDEILSYSYGGNITWVALGEVTGFAIQNDFIVLCVGEELTQDHIQAELIREGDVRVPVNFSQLAISDFDNTTVGRKQITISCGGYSATATVAVHQGRSNQVVDPALYPESDHDYGNSIDETKVLTIPGTESITLTFSAETKTESCDYIYVMDGSGNNIASFSGISAAGATVIVPGDTVQIRLRTDSSVTYYGYSFSEIRADLVEHTGTQIEAVAPTCEEAGHTAGVHCTICEMDTGIIELPALGHSYEAVKVDPTPTTQGYTTYTCASCGDSYTDDYTTYDNVANGTCGENLTWVLSFEGTLTISGTGEMEGYDPWDYPTPWGSSITAVVIEEGVASIGSYAFYDCDNLREITIPDSITIIGNSAFKQCNNLTDVTIGNSVISIGNQAFLECDSLTSITIPGNVTNIGERAFGFCHRLTGIYVDEENQNYSSDASGVLFNKEQTILIQAPGMLAGVYEIPDGVTDIGYCAFYYCQSLDEVTIPDSVTGIESTAFSFCNSLSKITIPDSVANIGYYAFENCDNLTLVTIGNSVTSIGERAFGNCDRLNTVYFTGNAPAIEYNAFNGVNATAYYPMNNTTWTESVLQSYGGSISWIGVGEIIGMELTEEMILLCAGETLNETHIQAELIRQGGNRTPVDFEDLTISEFDNSLVGRQEITVSYGEYTATATVAVHEGREEQVIDPSRYPESDHDYGNDLDETQVLTIPGAESIILTFSEQTAFESGWDYLHILNGNDEELIVYSGSEASGLTIIVAGDTVKLRLTTDGSSTRYGYSFTEIRANSVKHTGTATEGLDPTCTEDGYTAGIFCELCQADTGVAVLPALGHSYEAVVTDPTPEVGGYTTYTCSACGDSYVDNYTTYDNVASGVCGENLTWVLSFEGTLTISGTGAMDNYGSATLPWKNTPYAVKRAVLEEGVTAIGSYGFLNCEELEEITLPGTLTTIGYSAFNNCFKLKAIEIPDSVTAIENYAFLNCNALETVKLPAGIESINYGTFMHCTALTSVTIPDNVNEIYNEAFRGCTSLSEIRIPNSVSYIGSNVFYDCSGLTDVELPDGLTELPYGMFYRCTGLTQIVIPAGVTEICENAFYDCTSLTSVEIPEGVTHIGNNAFANCTNLKEIQLPQSLTELGTYAFSDCRALESFSIPEGITTIPHGLLIRCTGLKSVFIPDSVTRIEEWSFAETNSLTSVTIPDSVEYLGEYCFYTSDMKSVTIGAGVTEIAYNAFYCCYDLQTVTFTGNAPEIAENAFQDINITAYYPADNATWTETACQNYGGQITWVALGEMTGIRAVEEVVVAAVGDKLDISKLQIVSVHEDGTQIPLDPAVLTVGACDTSAVGRKNVTVSYGGYSTNIVVAVHNGQEHMLVDPSLYPESEHEYSNNMYEWQYLTVPGALSITLTFSDETHTESCDWIIIQDGNGVHIDSYSGTSAAGVTVTVPGDTVQILLSTDGSINYYGYSFSKIEANVLEHPGEAVGAKEPTCTEDGYTSAVHCEICDQIVRNDLVPMAGHEYNGVVTPPTPETEGYTTHTCINCGDSFVDSYVDYFNVASGDTGEVSWVLAYDGTLTIHGEGYMQDYEYYWTAPWLYCGYPVKYVIVEEGVKNIGAYAFYNGYQVETVTLASTVTSIGYSAFENCHNLKTVDICGRNTSIGELAFRNCHMLEAINIPDNTTYIGAQAFESCYSLTAIVLPEMLEYINYRTFANCTALQSIEIPQNVTMIDSYAFENCDSLQSISIPIMTTYIGTNALADCDNLTSIQVAPQNNSYCTDEFGVLFTKDMEQLIQAPGGLSGNYNVPESVNYIWEYAFANCNNLTGVTIPESVSFIEQGTFFSCDALVDVDMPDTITTIAYRAFAECVSMENIQIPNSVTAIVDYAFSECWSLNDVTFTGNAPSIDDWVFAEVDTNAYYPAGNETWTPDMLRDYGGWITWITSGDIGIIEQPWSYVTSEGKTASFFVEAVGKGLKYQWQYRASSSGSWKNVSAESGKTNNYFLTAQPRHNGYEYRCVITDSAGNEVYTNVATLFVLGITQQPASVYTKADGNAEFTVEATGMELYYQWQFRSSDKGQWAETSAEGCNTATLTVPAANWRDGYQYRCLITDITGNTVLSDAVTLNVLDITTQPVNRTIAIGSDAEFKVVATGGDLQYQWQYRTSSSGSWKNVSSASGKKASYTLTAQDRHNGYQYRCVITDAAGNKVTSNIATLYVWGINTQPESKTVKDGTTAKFTVEATGKGLTYQWQYRTSSKGSWKDVSAASGKKASYSLTAQTRHNGYQYRCKITNSAGSTTHTKTVTLYVLGIKTQPTHKTVKSGTSVTFKVSATGRSLTYQWQYRTSSDGSWKNVSAASAKTANYVLSAKVKHHGYQYRCHIKDAAGNSVYTNVVNLKVLGINTQPVSKTVVSGKTAQFTVSATGSNITYQWQYRTSSDGSWKNASAASAKTAKYVVSANVKHHGYQYRCKITDSAGNVIYTNTVNLYVLGIKTQPANKSVKAGTTAKFTVAATGNGLTYQWQYRTSAKGSWKNVSSASGKKASYSMTAQTRHNGYQYRCKITDSAGNVIYTDAAKLTVK